VVPVLTDGPGVCLRGTLKFTFLSLCVLRGGDSALTPGRRVSGDDRCGHSPAVLDKLKCMCCSSFHFYVICFLILLVLSSFENIFQMELWVVCTVLTFSVSRRFAGRSRSTALKQCV